MNHDDAVHEPLLLSSQSETSGSSVPVNIDVDEPEVERRLVRKLDRRMSILLLIYILNYIDRNNISAARLKGFERDLHLEGTQFASLLAVLYAAYTLMQIPSNMFLDYIGRPSIYLPSCMLLWGLFSALTGIANSFTSALITRFCVGFVEAAFFPGALFLISKWYRRTEQAQRMALLSCGSLISNAFGSVISAGILDVMEGVGGFVAWRWLFFIEGGLTMLVALWAMKILPDFPESTSTSLWLSPAEQDVAIQRIKEDTGIGADISLGSDEPSPTERRGTSRAGSQQKVGLVLALTDFKVWWLAGTLTLLVASLSFNAFFPTLMETIGYTPSITLLLCVPPWIFSASVALALSRHSDRHAERFWHITASLGAGIAGFGLGMISMNAFLRYFALCLIAQSYAGFMCFLAWASGSIGNPPAKRAVALAMINTISTTGNVMGSYFYPTFFGPTYRYSFAICAVSSGIAIVSSWAFRQHLRRLNEEADRVDGAIPDAAKGWRFML